MRGLTVAVLWMGLLALAGGLWLRNCGGPDPEVTAVEIEEPRQEGDPFVVRVTLENLRRNRGEVVLRIDLIDREGGTTYREEESVTLDGHERTVVAVEFHAPEGPEYEAEASASYPPD